MLPRRNSTNVASDHVSPQLTSGSFGGRQPLSIATNQRTFRAFTAGTLETESPQSEIPPQPQVTPPIPPRPTPFPPLPPRTGGLRRQSIRRNTYDTYASAIEEDVPASPQPTRLRQPAPGGGVGGFGPASPTQSDLSLPRHETAGISEGIHAGVWPTYNTISRKFDEKRLKEWNEDLDVLLIFVSLVVKGGH